MTLTKVEDLSVPRYGKWPRERVLGELLRSGVVVVDKPLGPTSHQVSAWVRDLLGLEKAAHGGTLDPRVTGVLPVALGEAVRALDALHEGDKEYVCVLRLHQDVPVEKVVAMARRFTGEIYQTPPVRAAVKRELRTRTIHSLQVMEVEGRDVLMKARCEAGTYLRTLCVDMGEALGVGGHMQDLRRVRKASFREEEAVALDDLRDALIFWREGGKEEELRRMVHPMERLLEHLPHAVVKDTTVDALCHGANLAVPGILEIREGIMPGDLVALYTRKGEGIALGRALMTSEQMYRERSGVAVDTERVLMEPGRYPKLWKKG
jgi:H/ACA ribonucleoprotein complex subunit 4